MVMVNIKVSREVRDAWKMAAGSLGVSAWLRQLAEVELASVRTPVVHPVNPQSEFVPVAQNPGSEVAALSRPEGDGIRRLPANWRPQPKPKVTFDDPRVIPGVRTAAEVAESHRLRRERGEWDPACLARGAHTVGTLCRLCGGSR